MQVNANYRKEMLNIDFSNRLLPNSIVGWPEQPMSVFDLLRDGEKEQYKSVQKVSNGFQGGDCSKLMCGVRVAYEVGDNDWYVFGYIDEQLKVYLQWRIPESFMDSVGMLSHRGEDGRFTCAGKASIPLHLVGPNKENAEIQTMIVGKMPRSDVIAATFPYVKVLKF